MAYVIFRNTLLAVLCALVLAPISAGSAVAVAPSLGELDSHLAHELAIAGPGSGAYVYDVTRKAELFSERAETAHPPASIEKLYTATTALKLMGAKGTLSTTVLGAGHLGPNGRWEGTLYLHGGGDPTFGSEDFIRKWYGGLGTPISELADQLVRKDGIRAVTGGVYGDESYLDSLRGDPSSKYRPDPELAGSLSALEFNRGEAAKEKGAHSLAAYAARRLRAALRAAGAVVGGGGARTAPQGTQLLATARSPTIGKLLGLMLPPSDNYFAETLVKDLGARFGGAGTTAAGATVVQRVVSKLLGIHPVIVDGSGLSHSDDTTPKDVVSLLSTLAPTSLGRTLRGDLAVAAKTGTLERRMRNTPAAGRCQGKTGTLDGVSNLAGYCRDASGDLIAFAFFDDGIAEAKAHTLQDNMTITLARY